MKIAILGDIHYPGRADKLPEEIFEMVKRERPDILVYTGDLDSEETLEKLKELCEKLVIVRGNVDYLDLPEKEIVDLGRFRILVIHKLIDRRIDLEGFVRIARENGCNIVFFGHLHYPFVSFRDGVLFVNPGSATGVVSGEGRVSPKSFAILEIEEKLLKVEVRMFWREDLW